MTTPFRSTVSLALMVLLAKAAEHPKTSLLPDVQLTRITSEASGILAKDTVIALGRWHRVHASPGFHEAAEYMAGKAREYGLEDAHVELFPADGKTTYNAFRSYYGWEAKSGTLTEIAPKPAVLADFSKMPVALADYSNDADVTATLIDVGAGTAAGDYANKDVKGRMVLAGGNVATAHHEAVEQRGAAGVLSYQPNQTTGWSGDLTDLVRWGHLSPYNSANTFAFMISLRQARELQARLAKGDEIRLKAAVEARVKPANFEVVTAIIPGTDANAGEIVYSSHLCHQKPGANDDASGAAVILEDARLLNKLIRDRKLPRPQRTIRFIWAPEDAGTMCYLARHADEIPKMRAAIHMDMVGGDPQTTKAILHLTRTPASLPSYVNDVAAVFGEYVIDGARRTAMDGDFTDGNVSPEGSKDMLLADFHTFTMGSDHEIYEEGSFRVPAIYLNDWPDVFIHTNGDVPSNLDATKLQRVAVIGAASGYWMAAAGGAEARTLAGEVFTRGGQRQEEALRVALAEPDVARAYNRIRYAAVQERGALESIAQLSPGVRPLLDGLARRVTERESADAAVLREFRGVAPAQHDPLSAIVPQRNPKVIGNLEVYYYDYIQDHVKDAAERPLDGVLAYEALNLVDGRRSVAEIRDILAASYEDVTGDAVLRYYRLLVRADVLSLP